MFNIEYMLNLFWINNTQGRELCWHDFLTYVFDAIICQDTFEQICFVLGMMLSTIEVYSLIPVGMTMMFTQGHRVMVMGNLELVQSFCSRVAWSSSIVHDGWLSKGDDCDEVVSVWWIWIVWAFTVLVCSVNINYEKKPDCCTGNNLCLLEWIAFLVCFCLSDSAVADCDTSGRVSQATNSDPTDGKGWRGQSVSATEGNGQSVLIVVLDTCSRALPISQNGQGM